MLSLAWLGFGSYKVKEENPTSNTGQHTSTHYPPDC